MLNQIKKQYKKDYGYEPDLPEIMSMYTSGQLSLTDEQEDYLSSLIN